MNFKNKKVRKYVKLRKIHFDNKEKFFKNSKCQSTYHFSLIREKYFINLQNVIKENLKSVEKESLSSDSLEKISLKIEQQALLACMQYNIYQAVMNKIIRNIKKSTKKMKLYFEIKNILSLNNKEVNALPSQQNEKEINECHTLEQATVKNEVYSHIPTISSVKMNHNDFNQHFLPNECESQITSENISEAGKNFVISSFTNCDVIELCETQDSIQTSCSPYTDKQHSSPFSCNSSLFTSNFISPSKNHVWNQNPEKLIANDVAKITENNERIFKNLLTLANENSKVSSEKNDISNEFEDILFSDASKSQEKIDPIALSRNKLQKSVEKSLKNFSRIKRLRKEEREKAQIAKILEGSLTSDHDENQLDSLSDESAVDLIEMRGEYMDRLSKRLEKMKQIFGMEENRFENKIKSVKGIHEDKSIKRTNLQKSQRFIQVWQHERTIQMHKYSMLASQTTPEMRNRNRNLFLKLFNDDSDEENEKEFHSEEKYLTSCKERISSWVVKYLMPFYNKRRIIGKKVFKSLGYHVSNVIIQQIQYPDEWTVQYLITKFFPSNIRFVNEEDVRLFQID